jgi:hypothetical protein
MNKSYEELITCYEQQLTNFQNGVGISFYFFLVNLLTPFSSQTQAASVLWLGLQKGFTSNFKPGLVRQRTL